MKDIFGGPPQQIFYDVVTDDGSVRMFHDVGRREPITVGLRFEDGGRVWEVLELDEPMTLGHAATVYCKPASD
jgi:hypothetical protein